jgi:plastocyanin
MRSWTLAIGAGFSLIALAIGGLARAASTEVTVHVFQFRPGTLDLRAGGTVTWLNRDDIGHTVTSGRPEQPDPQFDVALGGPGTSATVTFSEPGVYPYFCNRHRSMRGEIRVK